MLELQGRRRLGWKAMFPSWLQYQCHVLEHGQECRWFYSQLISHSLNTTRPVKKGKFEDCLKVSPILDCHAVVEMCPLVLLVAQLDDYQ